MLAWTRSNDGNLSVNAAGQQFFLTADDNRYSTALEAISSGVTADEFVSLMNKTVNKVRDYLSAESVDKTVFIEAGSLVYEDPDDGEREYLHGTMVDRLFDFLENGLPAQPLLNFIAKTRQNPSYQSAQELFDFLDHKSLPICEDGDFLAYKAVKPNFTDKRTGKKDNNVGRIVKESRRKVDDNRNNGCSNGLHAGTLDYVNSFGSFIKEEDGSVADNSDRCIIVKINPKHVVSVPLDSSCQKLRCEQYFVLKEFEGELDYHLATDDGDEWEDEEDADTEWEDIYNTFV